MTRGDGEWEGINNELAVAAQMQDAEIKATCQEIASFDYENDLAVGCQKIVGCTHRLLNTNDLLSDAVHKAIAGVLRQERRVPEDADRSDPLTGCVNRAGIEHDLSVWWAGVDNHERLCVALIDIDRLAETNEKFGYRVGNEIIKAIAGAAGGQSIGQRARRPVLRPTVPGHVFGHRAASRGQHDRAPSGRRLPTPISSTRTSASALPSVAPDASQQRRQSFLNALAGGGGLTRGETLRSQPHLHARRQVSDARRPAGTDDRGAARSSVGLPFGKVGQVGLIPLTAIRHSEYN